MKPQQRNNFLLVIAVMAVVGITAIFIAAPQRTTPRDEALIKTVRFKQPTSAGEIEREVLLVKIQTDVITGARFSSGNAQAAVKIIEFSDYQCPLCGAFATATEPLLQREYVDTGKVQVFFRDYPLPQHQHARITARLAACANDQGRFEEIKTMLFGSQREWTPLEPNKIVPNLLQRSSQFGMNLATLTDCFNSQKHDAAIEADYNLGQRLKLEGTPSFVVNGYLFAGALPIEGFRAILNEFL